MALLQFDCPSQLHIKTSAVYQSHHSVILGTHVSDNPLGSHYANLISTLPGYDQPVWAPFMTVATGVGGSAGPVSYISQSTFISICTTMMELDLSYMANFITVLYLDTIPVGQSLLGLTPCSSTLPP